MPEDIKSRLTEEGVLNDYYARPDYQQNDYLAWVARAAQEQTRQKRIDQMVEELRIGGLYMNMSHPASKKQ